MCCMIENLKIKVDKQEIGEDRFTGALDQKNMKNIRECGFCLNGTAISCSQQGRFKTRCCVEQCCVVTVVVYGFRIMEHHSEEKMGHIHFSLLFCGVDVYEATSKEI